MATILHPMTGVALNPIEIERKALNHQEAVRHGTYVRLV